MLNNEALRDFENISHTKAQRHEDMTENEIGKIVIDIAKSLCFSKNTGRIPCVYWFMRRKPDLFGYSVVHLHR